MEKILKVQDLVKNFGKIKAVDELSFSVEKGEIFGLLGPNGSGKSTTLRILLSLIKPDSGKIFLFGEPLSSKNYRLRERIGTLIERPDFYHYLTAFKNLEILSRISGKKISKGMIYEKLDMVGLRKFADRNVRIFSHGMKQRLGIAQALLQDSELIILDEPANGLDPHGVVDIRNIIIQLSRKKGITILLSSHILQEVELIADKMVVMHQGKAIAEGKVNELLEGKECNIKIDVDDKDRSVAILTSLGIRDIKINERGELIMNPGSLNSAFINDNLVKEGIRVKALIPARTLEEYFLKITENVLESNSH